MSQLGWMRGIVMGAIATFPLATTYALPLPPSSSQLRQVPDSTPIGCRETNSITGVYEQPNLDSASRGVLSQYQAVRLEVANDGWARINYPVVGWVEARYLSPPISCNELPTEATLIAPTAPTSIRDLAPSPTATPAPQPFSRPTPAESITAPFPSPLPTFVAICQVVPTEGLVVRSQPLPTMDTALYTLPQGEHRLQFTGQTARAETPQGIRTWLYITAPYEGWISPGFVGATSNLVGDRCG